MIITYTGTLKSKKTNIPFVIISTIRITQASALSIVELRTCSRVMPNENTDVIPNVRNAPKIKPRRLLILN